MVFVSLLYYWNLSRTSSRKVTYCSESKECRLPLRALISIYNTDSGSKWLDGPVHRYASANVRIYVLCCHRRNDFHVSFFEDEIYKRSAGGCERSHGHLCSGTWKG